jgi:hypothetical protein
VFLLTINLIIHQSSLMLLHQLFLRIKDLTPGLHDESRPAFRILALAPKIPIFVVEKRNFEIFYELVKSSCFYPMLSKIHKFLGRGLSLRF